MFSSRMGNNKHRASILLIMNQIESQSTKDRSAEEEIFESFDIKQTG